MRDAREREERTGPDLIEAAAKNKPLSPQEKADALDWFLSEDPDEGDYQKVIELNVGGPEGEDGEAEDGANPPHWIEWTIRPVDLDTLRRIRRSSQGNRAKRRGGEPDQVDEVEANLQIVFEGTVYPDLREAAKGMRLTDGSKGVASPKEALRLRFGRKPGLLGQIAGRIMSLSGYDDEDVRDAQAAKNS